MAGMKSPDTIASRDRTLADAEIKSIWQATEAIRAPLSAFYRVLLLTGQRREEVASMDWSELDRATSTWTIPASRAKNGTAHIVPLAPAVVEELDRLALARQMKAGEPEPDSEQWPMIGKVMSIRGGVSISCYSQAKKVLDEEVVKVREESGQIAPWRVHDLRRTLATGLQRLGERLEVVEAILNHVAGSRSGIVGIYQRHDWAAEKRAALEAWARHVAAILNPVDETNVVPLHMGAA